MRNELIERLVGVGCATAVALGSGGVANAQEASGEIAEPTAVAEPSTEAGTEAGTESGTGTGTDSGTSASTGAEAATATGVRLIAHQRVVALLNPMGAEHRFELSLRGPIGDQHDILFEGAHWQTGATSFVSPVYAIGGGFVEVAPFSFLVLRGEIMGAGVWPIGMNAAGHYGLTSYGDDVHGQSLPAANGGSATGMFAGGSATLQGAASVGEGVRLLFASELGLTYVALGNAPFYYSMKHDLVLAREDLVLTSSTFAGVEVRCASDLVFRGGAYDDLRHVPASGYVGHQLGPMVMLSWERVAPGLPELTVFVRGGGYTHHVTRAGEATILGGIALDYDLAGL